MNGEDWIFPITEGVCTDSKNGRWSDAAFFAATDEEASTSEWFQAEPAPHVEDQEVWKRCAGIIHGCRVSGATKDPRVNPDFLASGISTPTIYLHRHKSRRFEK
jgi:hypothetical protein